MQKKMGKRFLFPLSIGIVSLATLIGSAASAEIPIVGDPVPDLASLDGEMTDFMDENEISAGSLSVMHDGNIVFHRQYGWQDHNRQTPIRSDAMFRIASVTKPFTAAAIRKLIDEGRISLDTRAFDLGQPGGGVLDYSPVGTPDPRLKDITIGHLLAHRGGWDRDQVGDLTYREKLIASEMGVESPPGRERTVRYIMGQPLQNDPGATRAYSNIGYLLLGLIIENVSGRSYADFVGEHVIGPDNSSSDDWLLGRSFRVDQDDREPYYDDPALRVNVFYPASSSVRLVQRPFGSFDLEARTGQGRIVTHGIVILRFLQRFQVSGDGIGGPRPAPGEWRWNHTGALAGTNALARQRGDGINYVVLFNKRPSNGTSYASQMRTKLDAHFDTQPILATQRTLSPQGDGVRARPAP